MTDDMVARVQAELRAPDTAEWPTFPRTWSSATDSKESRPRYVFPADAHRVAYNPMMGTRLDLEVTTEDGATADKRHDTWRRLRMGMLERLIADAGTSVDARLAYGRELEALLLPMTAAQESCGFCLYGPPALCTCGTCRP